MFDDPKENPYMRAQTVDELRQMEAALYKDPGKMEKLFLRWRITITIKWSCLGRLSLPCFLTTTIFISVSLDPSNF
jgi:hypothetical protein